MLATPIAQAPSHNALRSQGCGSWHRCWLEGCFACWGFIGVYFGPTLRALSCWRQVSLYRQLDKESDSALRHYRTTLSDCRDLVSAFRCTDRSHRASLCLGVRSPWRWNRVSAGMEVREAFIVNDFRASACTILRGDDAAPLLLSLRSTERAEDRRRTGLLSGWHGRCYLLRCPPARRGYLRADGGH